MKKGGTEERRGQRKILKRGLAGSRCGSINVGGGLEPPYKQWSCFPNCWKVTLVVPVFNNSGESCTAKNYCPFSLLSVVSKVFEKLVNDRIVDHLEKCGLFSDFQYGFRSSQSTGDLPTVVSDRIAWAFNMSWATRAVTLDIQGFWQSLVLWNFRWDIWPYFFFSP